MGLRISLRLFKYESAVVFDKTFERVVCQYGGKIIFNELDAMVGIDCRTSHKNGVYSIYIPYCGGIEGNILSEIGRSLNVPWMELRIQEGTLWDFVLYRGARLLDLFSVDPSYWDDDRLEWERWKGHPDILAKAWNIPLQRIERYMVNWQPRPTSKEGIFEYTLIGKAYASDQSEYGDVWQMYDFLEALGASDPLNTAGGARQHRLLLPNKDNLNCS